MRQILHAESRRISDLTSRGPWYLNEDAELTQQTIYLSLAMGDDLYGQGTMRKSDCQAARELGALIDDELLNLGDSNEVDFTSDKFRVLEGTATFENGRKLVARLCLVSDKLTVDQAAGILFAVTHTPQLKAQVMSILSQTLSASDISEAESLLLREVFDPKTVSTGPDSEEFHAGQIIGPSKYRSP